MQHVFNWTREALLLPLEPGSTVIAIFQRSRSNNGSPLPGRLAAGAKATIRFIASYAADESGRNAWYQVHLGAAAAHPGNDLGAGREQPPTPPGRAPARSPPSSTTSARRLHLGAGEHRDRRQSHRRRR